LWSRLCRPVFLYDLVRLSRRGKATLFVARSLYVTVLLLLLLLIYARETHQHTPAQLWAALCAGFPLTQTKASSFSAIFCHALLATQFAVAVLLTPAFTAGAIGEERERRTLDFLLASDLSNWEIVIGKWLAYLARPTLVLLAGLPVFGIVHLLGGVEPNLILAAFAATLLTMASLGAVGMLVSLHTARPYAAILFTYAITAGYYLFFFAPHTDVLARLGAGNPLIALKLLEYVALNRSMDQVLLDILLPFAELHALITIMFLMGCIGELRRPYVRTPQDAVETVLRRYASQPPSEAAVEAARRMTPLANASPRRPEVSANPILWRELYVETGLSQTRDFFGFFLHAGIWLGLMLIGMSLLLVVLGNPPFLAEWVRWVGTSLACLLLLGVAVRAAGSFTRERERQTLDCLLASPLSSREIVNGKLLGSLLSIRRGFWCLISIWLLGAVTGNLKYYAVLMLLVTWVGYAFLAASIGVYCSLHSRSTWRATVATMWIVAVYTATPPFIGFLFLKPPPETLMIGLACFGQQGYDELLLYYTFVFLNIVHYLVALGFWHLTALKFSAATGRIEGFRRRPDFAHPPKKTALPSPPSRSLC
jgi:ABC-type transport system involved in multi-copper enzyme maturation permease subunit